MATQEPQWWKKKRLLFMLSFIALVAMTLIVMVIVNNGTGFEESINTTVSKATTGTNPATVTITSQHQPGKTLWDWMQLLIIPVILAIGAFAFNFAQTRTEQQIAAQRYQNDQEIATTKQREDLLQIYLDRLSALLLDKNLRSSQPEAEVRNVARARTLTVLPQLDARRQGSLMQFLSESHLLEVISLSGANLKGADLSGINLRGADLSNANLDGADLHIANLSRANLSRANLSNVNLFAANLSNANLSEAILETADLHNANLSEANLSRAYLRNVDVFAADLHNADLHNATLVNVSLSDSNLSGADLSGAYLNNVDLSGAIITQQQLDSTSSEPD